jgi:hypothetical protein
MKKTVLFKQPAGLGDILFCLKIAETIFRYCKNDCNIIWPVNKNYVCLSQYITPSVPISFPSVDGAFEYKDIYEQALPAKITPHKNCSVITLDGCAGPEGVMKAKYNMVKSLLQLDVNWDNWQGCFSLNRNFTKEDELFSNLNRSNEKYALINQHVGTAPTHTVWKHIDTTTDIKKIYMNFIDGYNIFDWCRVIENAEEIHMEGSALTYIIEKLNMKTNKLCLFSRDHNAIDEIFKTPWKKQ